MSPKTEIVPIRCLKDNYAYLLHCNGKTALFDAPEAQPILDVLGERGWTLNHILLTHHHDDHVQAVPELVEAFSEVIIPFKRGHKPRVIPPIVTGAAIDAYRLPSQVNQFIVPGHRMPVVGLKTKVMGVSGHTIGHLAYFVPDVQAVFTGDSLMALGCGRIFEGTPEMAWESLKNLNTLHRKTRVYSGHDYCAGNAAFALSVDPDNKALKARVEAIAKGVRPCVPATLDEERATNPFLRAEALASSLGVADAPAAFAKLRQMKDDF
ncbi:MAG: hydroxyacylglutathione hydrolase [Paracoccus sp. (in: a-proteobacteria)]